MPQDAWLKAQRCWLMRCYQNNPTSVDAELPISIAVSVRQPSATDGAGAGDRLQGHIGPSYSEVGIYSKNCTDRCGDIDPAIRQCTQFERAFPHALP